LEAGSQSEVERRITADLTNVVVVAADSGAELGTCIEHVLASNAAVELIVSDNASSDGSVDAVAARWVGDTRVRIVHNGENLGFGAGCNRGAASAHGDAILFLNPDCRIQADTLARLLAWMAADTRIGLVGATIIGVQGESEPASRRRDPLLRRALMSLSGLARFESRWPALAGATLPARADKSPLEDVDAVSGALMLLPRAVFDRIGGFDEGYFLHCEDLDLCRRVREAGLRVVCANDVRVVHVKGTSSRSRPVFVARHKHRGMWRWFTKFDPSARNPLLRVLVWSGLWMHFALLLPRYAWKAARQR
jgi:N-acetylglucosaminyl-diphospho-decaprenol L-rhamnosyltransferase